MKKAVLSLIMTVACLSAVFGQGNTRIVSEDTIVSCKPYEWSVTQMTYNHDTVVSWITPDTIFILNLTVTNGLVDTTTVVPLEGSCFATWNGHKVFKSGIILDTTRTVKGGCDSVVNKLNVTLTGFVDTEIDTMVCGSFKIPGDTVAKKNSGLYQYNDSASCEAVSLNLTISPVYNDTTAVAVQSVTGGCYYKLGDSVYTKLNINYYNTIPSSYGCDSLVGIRITSFTNVQYDTTRVTYCGTEYNWKEGDSSFFNAAGEYDTTFTKSGCEKHMHLVLNFTERDTVIIEGPYCETHTFSFRHSRNGADYTRTITESGRYGYHAEDTSATYVRDTNMYSYDLETGCITRTKLDVTIYTPEERVDSTLIVEACDEYKFRVGPSVSSNPAVTLRTDTTLTKTYTRRTNNRISNYNDCYNETGTIVLTLKHKSSVDTNVVACDKFTWNFNNKTYTRDTVVDQVLEDETTHKKLTNIEGCDSVGRLRLVINKTPKASIEGEWMLNPGDTTVLTAVSDIEGVSYLWKKDNEVIGSSKTVTVVAPQEGEKNLAINLVTTASYKNNQKCATSNWLTITSYKNGINDVEDVDVNVYPNPASYVVNINSDRALESITIYNAIGQKVEQVEANGENASIALDRMANGEYIMNITTSDGKQALRKLVIKK